MRSISTQWLVFLTCFLCMACAKEIYTNEDATRSQLDAQKVGLDIMIKDANAIATDLSGFVISTSQCGQTMSTTTSASGWGSLMLFPGDAALIIERQGYPTVTVLVTLNKNTTRTNTVIVVPVFQEESLSGDISGTVNISKLQDDMPIANALVSVEVDFEQLMAAVFSGLDAELIKYRPAAISYAANLMKPATTDHNGSFKLNIPITNTQLEYLVHVHEIQIDQEIYNAKQVVTTDGRTSHIVNLQLTPCSL